MSRIAYVNGQYVPHHQAAVSIEDRGFLFADSVYEVFALMEGVIADRQGHMDRLARSLAELRIPVPLSRSALHIVLREIIRRNRIKNAMIYLQVTRGVASRKFTVPDNLKPGIVIMLYPLDFDINKRKKLFKKAVTMPDARWARRDIKTTMLLPSVLAAQAAADQGGNDAWFVNDEGYITEAAASNAWIVDQNGVLVTTPAKDNDILKGVTRTAIFAICKDAGIKIAEQFFTAAEVMQAAEAFTSSATVLIAPVVEIDGQKIGNGALGPVTEKIMDSYFDYVYKGDTQERWTA